jgi:glycosyltransferase involved in cell wall biosynthesis
MKALRTSDLPHVLFVGGFSAMRDSTIGGTVFACRSLLSSGLSDKVKWLLLDYTMESLPPPLIFIRMLRAFRRFTLFLLWLATKRIDTVLIFSSTGMSLLEKGIMAWVAAQIGKRVCFSPRSGCIGELVERSLFFAWFVPWVLRSCRMIVCQCRAWRDFYQRITRLPRDRFVVIYNGIDVSQYSGKSGETKKDEVICLYMSALLSRKGIYDLVGAISLQKGELAGVRFVIAGDGPEREFLKEFIKDHGLFQMLELVGWVEGERKLQLLSDADIFLFPSHAEGMPNALLEAMAAGCACIASRVGGCPELIPDDRYGLLIPPGDITALGKGIACLAHDRTKREAMGAAARQRVIANNDIQKIWPQFWDILNG